jgi:hypothetical protein
MLTRRVRLFLTVPAVVLFFLACADNVVAGPYANVAEHMS